MKNSRTVLISFDQWLPYGNSTILGELIDTGVSVITPIGTPQRASD